MCVLTEWLIIFCVSRSSGGLSNYLYACSLPAGMECENGEPRKVLLRIYGAILQGNSHSLVVDSVVFALLSEKNIGPKLYGVFEGGRIEEYIYVSKVAIEFLILKNYLPSCCI